MKKFGQIATLSCLVPLLLPSTGNAQGQQALFLVQDNQPRSVIVLPANADSPVRQAIEELQYHLNRTSRVTLPVVDEAKAGELPADIVRIVFTKKALPLETYRVEAHGNTLVFTGDGGKSNALQWAVDYYLDSQLGVRWLWPGDVGTHVPVRSSIPLPQIDYQGRPVLEQRRLRNALAVRSFEGSPTLLTQEQFQGVVAQSEQWLRRFQMGSRSQYKFGHAFMDWWAKYGQAHPEYFAVPPPGSDFKQPGPVPNRIKLNIGNEAIDDAIINEWKATGAPANWNVCPNDGVGFDTSAASRALDDPPDQDPDLIWGTAQANLTARYVKFWNRLLGKMRKIDPEVTLSSYAYSAYRNPPQNGLKLQPGIVLGLVPSYWAQDHWQQWQEAGARLFLRPNWWHAGSTAPLLPLRQQGDFFRFAQGHNMVGFDFDTLQGHWATQGAMYYVIARLSVRPEMSVEAIIEEYCSAFGQASPSIKEYLDYWETFTRNAGYPAPAGGGVDPLTPGAVGELVKKHNLHASPLVHGWQVIPSLYTDEVLHRGYAILDRATLQAAGEDDFVTQRIDFLRAGLDHLKLTRDVLHLGTLKQRNQQQQNQYLELSHQLLQMRRELTLKHVVWGEAAYVTEKRRHAPTMPLPVKAGQEDMAGL